MSLRFRPTLCNISTAHLMPLSPSTARFYQTSRNVFFESLFNFDKERIKLLANCSSRKHLSFERSKGFAAAMAEALDKIQEQDEIKKSQRLDSEKKVKKIKEMKNASKRRKYVDWQSTDAQLTDEEVAAKRAAFDPADRIKKKKFAILLSYCGAKYFGMQRNPDMPTIEEEVFKVMLKHKWISQEGFEQIQATAFQRAARTDKGVSAARQVCSIKLPEDLDLEVFNKDLPEDIRLFGMTRVTKGFNAKDTCTARTYSYTMPTIAFANHAETHEYEQFRLNETLLNRIRDILKMYEGTKNFHNFTSRKNFLDPSAKRFMMSFTCTEPFLSPQGIEFVTLKVKGQSFMLHQIRKMVGLSIAIVRGNTTTATMERAFSEERLDLPMAPGLGLVLDKVHYERYNERYGKDGIHAPLIWEKEEPQIQEFIEKYIYSNIYETEATAKNMLDWIGTLHYHSYDTRRDETYPEKVLDKSCTDTD